MSPKSYQTFIFKIPPVGHVNVAFLPGLYNRSRRHIGSYLQKVASDNKTADYYSYLLGVGDLLVPDSSFSSKYPTKSSCYIYSSWGTAWRLFFSKLSTLAFLFVFNRGNHPGGFSCTTSKRKPAGACAKPLMQNDDQNELKGREGRRKIASWFEGISEWLVGGLFSGEN